MAKIKRKRIILFPIILIILVIGIGVYYFNDDLFGVIDNSGSSEKNKSSDNDSEKEELLGSSEIENSMFSKGYKKAQEIVSKMTLEEKIGQLFLVRYSKEELNEFNNYYPGGYILFARDFENHTKESIKSELDNNQKNSKYPLILGVDEEGGFVTRVSRFKEFRSEKFKSPKDYYNEGGYQLLESIEKEKAELLLSLGLNLNLAPVSDVSVDSNDFIYNRAFGEDANKTSEYVSNMIGYANKNGINSCLKHFPGYGNNQDTHTGVAIDNRSYEEISNNDYLPFKAGIEAKVPSVLVSHNVVKAIDPDYPSSLSKKVVGELREKLAFSGIIMTDDLAMDAVKSYVDNGEAATLAINAGCDMIITSDFINMDKELIDSVNSGKIDVDTINKAVLRIISWKVMSNLIK